MSNFETIDFTALEPDIQKLIREGATVREFSYSPYSKFKVGSAILCDDGSIFRGCNIENASYPVSTCAEKAAIACAVSAGKRKFKAIAVVADHSDVPFATPCGSCRQTIAEFDDIPVFLARSDMKTVLRTRASDLLPLSFALKPDQLIMDAHKC